MNRMAQTIPQTNVTTSGREQLRGLPAGRVIPYEYVADFALKGEVGNLVQDVINISVEGVFVAVSIGYAFDEDKAERFAPLTGPDRTPSDPTRLGDVTLDNIPPDLLIEGFRVNPDFRSVLVTSRGELNKDFVLSAAEGIFERLTETENFGFLLSIVDTATGRELQNEPVHSVATLGRADGRRPFKMLPQPVTFMPRSTIRLQVEERVNGAKGRLFITLQGYKILGLAGALEEEVRRLGEFDPLQKLPTYDHQTGGYYTLGEAVRRDIPTTRIVPFDYVSTLDLTGKRGNILEDEIPVNVDGGYVATSVSYSLDAGETSVNVDTNAPIFTFEITIESLARLRTGGVPDDVLGKLQNILNREQPGEKAFIDLVIETIKEIEGGFDSHGAAILEEAEKSVSLKLVRLIDIIPIQALFDGIRFDPLRVKFAFSNGRLPIVDEGIVGRIFQRLNRPEDVRFLYSISDSGTGRDLQNQRVHNLAGLGIANGDRPFKVFHKPMVFLPRSTIRVQVEEIFGRGRLFIVFQGYKVLR